MNASSSLVRLALAAAALLLTQCSMPPRDAWRIVQSEGLIPYLAGDYSYQPDGMQPGMAQSRYLASGAAPLQHSVTPAPVVPSAQETGPVANRYLAGSYYQPEQQAASERSRPKPTPAPRRTPASESVDGPTPPPTVNTAASDSKKIDNLLEPKDKPASPPAKLAVDELPYGTPVPGRAGMVNSPFATKDQLVDVTGMSVGETVKCPYSGKLFRVPPTQAAAAAPKSTLPEPPPPAPEPKSEPAPDKPVPDASDKAKSE